MTELDDERRKARRGIAYLRLVIDAESASIHNTDPLQEAFGMAHRSSSATIEELSRIDPARIVHPVRVTWTGRRSDILQGNLGFRSSDVVLSDAWWARLADARIGPHLEIPVLAAKADKWGIRILGPEIPHRWIAWTRANDLLNDVDWEHSRFLFRPSMAVDDPGLAAASEIRSFRARAELEEATRIASERCLHVDLIDLAWADSRHEELDLFVLPRVRSDALYVSDRLALALLARPKLAGFRIFRSDRSEVKLSSKAK